MKRVGVWLRATQIVRVLLIVPILLAAILYLTPVYGAGLPNRSVRISDSRTSQIAQYSVGFDVLNPQVLGSIRIRFCSNNPIRSSPCTAPTGFNVSGATLTGQSGELGFTILGSGTNANTIVLSRVPSPTTAISMRYILSGVLNTSVSGSQYARLETFTSGDASGPDTEDGGVAFSINDAIQITTTVPPYLLFCQAVSIPALDCAAANGNYINFGNLRFNSTASGTSQMLTATNAQNGFMINVYGTSMTSGNNTIRALLAPDVSRPGQGQFGFNLRANATPNVGQEPAGPGVASIAGGYNQPDFYTFNSGDILATTPTSDDFQKLTVSYIINIPQDQPIGVYVSTLTYVCLANF